MKNLIIISVIAILTGCATAEKPTLAKGKWQPVNQRGFIPANTTRYIDGVDIFLETERQVRAVIEEVQATETVQETQEINNDGTI